MTVGIDLIHFSTADYFLGLDTFAQEKGIDVDKYTIGIGQDQMSIAPPDEDIVTLAAKAAKPILDKIDPSQISAILFATESSVDQSKSSGVFLHGLLKLSKRCRVVELKQACYAGAAALQMAATMVKANPKENILVVSADIARYDVDSSGEATQGCGAVAMLVKQNPRILALESGSGYYTDDVMDFWRPNHRDTALVDGKYSTMVYLNSLKQSWEHYTEETGRQFHDIDYFCYHIPFTKMAEKAHKTLARKAKVKQTEAAFSEQCEYGQIYNRVVGNSYTASLFISLCSLLDYAKTDLQGKRVSLFSYGSGCVAEFFSGVIQPHYQNALFTQTHQKNLENRKPLSYPEYLNFYHGTSTAAENLTLPKFNLGAFRFSEIKDHKRLYQAL